MDDPDYRGELSGPQLTMLGVGLQVGDACMLLHAATCCCALLHPVYIWPGASLLHADDVYKTVSILSHAVTCCHILLHTASWVQAGDVYMLHGVQVALAPLGGHVATHASTLHWWAPSQYITAFNSTP